MTLLDVRLLPLAFFSMHRGHSWEFGLRVTTQEVFVMAHKLPAAPDSLGLLHPLSACLCSRVGGYSDWFAFSLRPCCIAPVFRPVPNYSASCSYSSIQLLQKGLANKGFAAPEPCFDSFLGDQDRFPLSTKEVTNPASSLWLDLSILFPI